jgi:16S rRNA (uracil1498-N3)-methyltransferase
MRINSFVTPEMMQNDLVVLSPEESHHLARVLRVEAGQEMTLFDGHGERAEGVVEAVDKKQVTVRVTARESVPPPKTEITLIQAVCKPDRFEIILQKATELGVRTIQPVLTANASLPKGKIDKMIARGEAIIRNAAQQCGTAWLPTFQRLERWQRLPASVQRQGCRCHSIFPDLGNYDVCFIGSLHPGAKPFKKAFEELRGIKHKDSSAYSVAATGGRGSAVTDRAYSNGPADLSALRVALLIGPEGDFTEEEVNSAVEAGAIPVCFGDRILRTETAAIFGLSVLAYELF